MAYTMETSPTANAAKLAILWRDKDKRGGAGGSGVPDHFAEDIFEGGILPEVIQPPQPPTTTNPDGTTTPADPVEPTLADHKTVFTDSQDLKSIYGALLDIRVWLAPVTNPTASLKTVPDMGVLIGGSVYTALKAIEEAVEDFEGRLATVGGALSEATSDAAAARSAAESALDSVQRLDQQVTSQIQQLQRDQISAENRIRRLEDDYTSLSQRVGMLESGTSGQ